MEPGFQQYTWANGVGDDWLQRNRDKLGTRDLASEALERLDIKPKSVLEIGCANGWRLKKLKEKYGCEVAGVDVSELAVKEAAEAGIRVERSGADFLPFPDNRFDTVIYGFCLCFISPEEWLKMVLECDRVLQDGGQVVIYDFYCIAYVKRRILNITSDPELEVKPVYMYNYNWPKLWTGHPAYRTRVNLFDINQAECCTVIDKNMSELLVDFDRQGERVA